MPAIEGDPREAKVVLTGQQDQVNLPGPDHPFELALRRDQAVAVGPLEETARWRVILSLVALPMMRFE